MDCPNCKNALFNELWGEYKCTKREITIYKPTDEAECEYYENGSPGLSKDDMYDYTDE